MDSSEMKGDDCNPKGPFAGRNTTKRIPGSNGVGVDRNGIGNGTWRLLASNASMSFLQ
jgi:hypothetical protein